MTKDGRLYPVFKFEDIIDTEIGLIKLIHDRYADESTFYYSLLDAPIKFKIGLLYDRTHPNPLTVIAQDRDNIELLDDYYQQFMTEEYVYILKHAIVTNLYTLIINCTKTEGVTPIIVCSNDMEKNYLLKINNEVFKKCEIIITDNFGSAIGDRSDSIYIKNIRNTLPILNKIAGKNVYISSYRYNFEDDERTKILSKYSEVLNGIMKINKYDPYNEKDIMRGK